MFESINHTTQKVHESDVSPSKVVPTRLPEGTNGRQSNEAPADAGQAGQVVRLPRINTEQDRPVQEVTQEMLEELEMDIEAIHNIGLRFSKHNDTGRTMIKILDKETKELIREVPSEEALDLIARIEEMIGILFDRKV